MISLDLTVLDQLDDDTASIITIEHFVAVVAALTERKFDQELQQDHSNNRCAWENNS